MPNDSNESVGVRISVILLCLLPIQNLELRTQNYLEPLLYQQRAASIENRIKKSQFRHHFSLKFACETKPFHPQELPEIITYVTRIFLRRYLRLLRLFAATHSFDSAP
jgi:hypothetical protein